MATLAKKASPLQALPPLLLMTDCQRLPNPAAALARLPRGCAVILRDYQMADRPALARRLRRLTKDRGLRLLVAADARLACAIGADGFHLPEAAACSGNRTWRRWRRPGWLVTAAAHSPRAMFASAALAVDAVLLSPVFSTASHPEATPLGALRFARMVRASPLPVYALGGVTAPRMGLIGLSGAVGVAGISGIADIATRRRRWRRRAPAFPQASAS